MRTFILKPGPKCPCPIYRGNRIFDADGFFAGIVEEVNYDSDTKSYSVMTNGGRFYWLLEFDKGLAVVGSHGDWKFHPDHGFTIEEWYDSFYKEYEDLQQVEDIEAAFTESNEQPVGAPSVDAGGHSAIMDMITSEWDDYCQGGWHS